MWVANLHYKDSVEDRVHNLLSYRLTAIHNIFGQIPDALEDAWVEVALGEVDRAKTLINRTEPTKNSFDENTARSKTPSGKPTQRSSTRLL